MEDEKDYGADTVDESAAATEEKPVKTGNRRILYVLGFTFVALVLAAALGVCVYELFFAETDRLFDYLYVFLVSMVPLIELRGAIPLGTGLGLPWYMLLPFSVIANCIPVPFILLLIRWFLDVCKRSKIRFFNGIANWIDRKVEKNRDKITKFGFWGLMLFVAIPLPGTGAWTGTVVAGILDMKKKDAFLSAFFGVCIAGLIMTVGSQAVAWIVSLF